MSDYAKGLEGVIANESALSRVEGLDGKLSYLGYDIDDLVEHCCFGEVTYLLLKGRLPNSKELENFQRKLHQNRSLPPQVVDFIKAEDDHCVASISLDESIHVFDVNLRFVQGLQDLTEATRLVRDFNGNHVSLVDGKAAALKGLQGDVGLVDQQTQNTEVRSIGQRERKYIDTLLT